MGASLNLVVSDANANRAFCYHAGDWYRCGNTSNLYKLIAGAWSLVVSGPTAALNPGMAMVSDGSILYMYGQGSGMGSTAEIAYSWTGSGGWNNLGFLAANPGMYINSACIFGGELYVAAYNYSTTKKIIKWNGSAWSVVATITLSPTNNSLFTLVSFSGGLYVVVGDGRLFQITGGAFVQVAPTGIGGNSSAPVYHLILTEHSGQLFHGAIGIVTAPAVALNAWDGVSAWVDKTLGGTLNGEWLKLFSFDGVLWGLKRTSSAQPTDAVYQWDGVSDFTLAAQTGTGQAVEFIGAGAGTEYIGDGLGNLYELVYTPPVSNAPSVWPMGVG